jgi:hypothetical protein
MNTQTTENSATTQNLAIYSTGRGLVLDGLAREQAILNHAKETEMT